MKNNVLTKVAIIIAICIASVALAIGFVTVTKLSNIKADKEKVTNAKYSLYFDKDSLKETIGGKAITDKKNTAVQGTNVTGIIALKEKGDTVTYTWNIINNGSVDAELIEMPTILGLQDNFKEAIGYELYINDEKAHKGSIVEAGDITSAKLVIIYKKDTTITIDPTTIQVVSTTLNFQQK